jgi:SOS response regulatory protein OraA/RecX
VPVVTALRARGSRVAVELDGAPWRTLPLDAVATAGLVRGAELDRERARVLARALRRTRAEDVALRALARGDHSRASLDARLERAGVAEEDRRHVIERAARARLVDDARYAETRATSLAARGNGDALILDDLARRGVGEKLARGAVAALEPEQARASRVVAERGASVRTIRYLAARGFSEDVLEGVIADVDS